MLRQLGKGLFLAGFATFIGAVVWWYLFYAQLLAEDVKMASECFYRTTADCAIGNVVVSTFGDIPVYSPDILWLAAGLAGFGAFLIGAKPGTDTDK